MRHNYYFDGGDLGPGPTPPFGDVPPQSGGGAGPGWSSAPVPGGTSRRRTPDPRGKSRRRSGTGVFIACVAVLLGLSLLTLTVRKLYDAVVPDYVGAQYDQWDQPAQPELETTVERAPTGDGTTLPLAAPPAVSLTPQEIYEKTYRSIAEVRVTRADGVALGTAVLMSSDGYLITNAHVVEYGQEIETTLADETKLDARLVGMDKETDLAVLKIDGAGLPAAEFSDSSVLRVGDTAYAIGNPLGDGLQRTMTEGIISGIDRTMPVEGMDMVLIQTSAAINSGNSGGALVNQYGQVVGITNMKMMSYYDTLEGLGFAVPSATAKVVVDQLIAQGYVSGRPALGVEVRTKITDSGSQAGAEVTKVKEHSDAGAKGLRAGDVIVSADGVTVDNNDDLKTALADCQVGDRVALGVQRDGKRLNFSVVLMDQHLFE